MEPSKIESVKGVEGKFILFQACGPFLDIALKKLGLKLDWDIFTEKFLRDKNARKIYYHFDYYSDDFRGTSFKIKLEKLGFEIVTRRLPPVQQKIVKERIASEICSDLCFELGKRQAPFRIILLCPFIDLVYAIRMARKFNCKITLMDFSDIPGQLVAEASELIIFSESDKIFLNAEKEKNRSI